MQIRDWFGTDFSYINSSILLSSALAVRFAFVLLLWVSYGSLKHIRGSYIYKTLFHWSNSTLYLKTIFVFCLNCPAVFFIACSR